MALGEDGWHHVDSGSSLVVFVKSVDRHGNNVPSFMDIAVDV